jgi:hypothetical protein
MRAVYPEPAGSGRRRRPYSMTTQSFPLAFAR